MSAGWDPTDPARQHQRRHKPTFEAPALPVAFSSFYNAPRVTVVEDPTWSTQDNPLTWGRAVVQLQAASGDALAVKSSFFGASLPDLAALFAPPLYEVPTQRANSDVVVGASTSGAAGPCQLAAAGRAVEAAPLQPRPPPAALAASQASSSSPKMRALAGARQPSQQGRAAGAPPPPTALQTLSQTSLVGGPEGPQTASSSSGPGHAGATAACQGPAAAHAAAKAPVAPASSSVEAAAAAAVSAGAMRPPAAVAAAVKGSSAGSGLATMRPLVPSSPPGSGTGPRPPGSLHASGRLAGLVPQPPPPTPGPGNLAPKPPSDRAGGGLRGAFGRARHFLSSLADKAKPARP